MQKDSCFVKEKKTKNHDLCNKSLLFMCYQVFVGVNVNIKHFPVSEPLVKCKILFKRYKLNMKVIFDKLSCKLLC